jgi:hypothetical protein
MTLFDAEARLAPIRTGRFADLASSLSWFIGLIATFLHPAGLGVAGILLGLTASSLERAFAASAAFSITIVAAGTVWLVLTGSLPITTSVAPSFIAFISLLVPPAVALLVRWML